MIVIPTAACSSFTLHHLGEFECPHQYDVKIRVQFQVNKNRVCPLLCLIPFSPKDANIQRQFCKFYNVNSTAMFTVQPEFILPLFVQNPVPFVTDITAGFFGSVVFPNVTFIPTSIPFFAEFGVVSEAHLKYYLLPASEDNGNNHEFIMWHVVTVPPDFDQVLRVSIPSFHWPRGRNWPLVVEPGRNNGYANRLLPGQSIQVLIDQANDLFEMMGKKAKKPQFVVSSDSFAHQCWQMCIRQLLDTMETVKQIFRFFNSRS
jgi:hypothetical protein